MAHVSEKVWDRRASVVDDATMAAALGVPVADIAAEYAFMQGVVVPGNNMTPAQKDALKIRIMFELKCSQQNLPMLPAGVNNPFRRICAACEATANTSLADLVFVYDTLAELRLQVGGAEVGPAVVMRFKKALDVLQKSQTGRSGRPDKRINVAGRLEELGMAGLPDGQRPTQDHSDAIAKLAQDKSQDCPYVDIRAELWSSTKQDNKVCHLLFS